ncbi:hypothetical protein NE235_22135 [Actinoallomurus spadix]|uniref:NlpC/P60 domain-containing protein n=1 Tax=Actinoallomurus spadix TaxID=79912 RepID=A0ABN0XDF2_9ACTN|nr:hypothetical protein [Actinoallomurus spadix]MCO5988809.1 hypothetical protein [Actinoallomurus spadix]
MPSSRRLRITLGVAAVGAVAAIGVPSAVASSAGPAARPVARPVAQDVSATATITRAQVIARAKTWHPHTSKRVPYSQNKTHGGYRTDCSGYVSMALALSKPGPNTVGLASKTYSTRIGMASLQKGDLVIDASGNNHTRHVVIFERWVNSKTKKSYWAYEQRGGYGTDHRVLKYGLSKGSQYHAYRPKKIR